eukprot:CAMPEP_0169279022 /NCGR_PEP_ID=MMETSP1016-20121227/54704_1 /TAXON_ID=342587 /ORGANISM="Karlodinium micrum, Strain CCMP2283" /LENGTH=81 /DNA_ID=CAMNT_0009366957 /DNA_START=33 /DNA_END=274 /DNA_ORIENTATION=+
MSAFLPDMPTTDALSPLLQILSPETLRLEHIETSSPTVKPPGISRSSSSSSSSSSVSSSSDSPPKGRLRPKIEENMSCCIS